MHTTLEPVLILLGAAVLVVVVCRSLGLPTLAGYLIMGAAIGPRALGLIHDTGAVSVLAEIGVAFLMFSIGLEFNLPKLRTMRRIVFGLGLAQVVATLLAVLAVAVLAGLPWQSGVALGGALAMSSTAILARLLAERLELNSEHGRRIIGILLFQDLAVVPLLVIIPALAAPPEQMVTDLVSAFAKAAVVLTVLLFVGQRLMRGWFHVVARRKSSELFVLNVLLVTLGIAYITEISGLSLALGAFIAGVLISETEYRYQVEDDIKPFRDILLGLFFVSIGMLLDVNEVIRNGWISVLLVGFMLVKTMLIFGLARMFGADAAVALRTGLALGACGEFGFVLLSHANGAGLLEPALLQPVLAAMVLSMLIAPFIMERSEHIVRRLISTEWTTRAMQLTAVAARAMDASEHVVICGYGRTGQNLARLLEHEGVPFIALDNDSQRVREAAAAGESVVFGDAGRREVLVAAGLLRAKVLAITYADTPSALRVLEHVRHARPGLPVVVRTQDDVDMERLKDAGAAEVIPEIMEGSLMLASSTLMLLGTPLNRVLRRIRQTRTERYALFRGFYRGVTDAEDAEDASQPRLHSVVIAPGAAAIGKSLADLDLANLNISVNAVRRRNVRTVTPRADTRIEEGDVLVLMGLEEDLAAAEMRLLQG
ncbi:MAG: monovalent cation:proton antiporter-2 (CPA2) family protein [Betaproteobacteria bacterium]